MELVSLHRLRVFLAVARRLSFSRAAGELYISQPAVSKHVHKLEQELGVSLLGQAGNRIYPTEAGRIVTDYAQRIFALLEEARRALQELEGLERGYLRLGASSTAGIYILPAILVAFRGRYPGIEVSLALGNSQDVEQMVLRNELDLGFAGARFLPELHVQPFVVDELALIVPPTHPFASRSEVSAHELAREPFLLREPGSATRRALEEELLRLEVNLQHPMVLCGSEAIKRSVAAGLGISVVSTYSATLELASGLVKKVAVPGMRLASPLSIISHKDVRPSVAALAFQAMVRKLAPS